MKEIPMSKILEFPKSFELKINPSLRDLIPPLADHERDGLEEDIKHFGCYTPIITWNGFIIDGHHRYEICSRHKLAFKTEEKEFEKERDVRKWMIKNQFSRRNLTDFVRGELVLSLEEILREEAEEASKANLVQSQVTDNQESTRLGQLSSQRQAREGSRDIQRASPQDQKT